MKKFDIGIVGGGPAGSYCAYNLVKGGKSVIIFDDSHPREKPCGGGLSNRVVNEFNIPKEIIDREADKLLLTSPKGISNIVPSNPTSYIVMREKFDLYLLKKAIKCGAKLIEKRVKRINKRENDWEIITEDNNKFFTKKIIGADGVNSTVRKTLSNPIPKDHLGVTVGYYIHINEEFIDSYFNYKSEFYFSNHKKVNKGYYWIFAKKEFLSLGFGAQGSNANFNKILTDFLMSQKNKEWFNHIISKQKFGALIPFVTSRKYLKNDLICGSDWALIGDAACHVNPFTGEGIYYAMRGAKIASDLIIAEKLHDFKNKCGSDFYNDLIWGIRFKKFLYSKFVLNTGVRLSKHSVTLSKLLGDIISSNVKYNWKLFFKMIYSFPIVIFENIFNKFFF